MTYTTKQGSRITLTGFVAFCKGVQFISGSVTASCHLSLRACNRSIFASGLSIIDSRAYVISQPERGVPLEPIRTPEWASRLSGQRRIRFTHPRSTPEQERHLVISFRRPYFPQYIFSPHLSVLGHWAILIWGESSLSWGLYVKQTDTFRSPYFETEQLSRLTSPSGILATS